MASGVEEVTADTAPPDRQDEESDLSRDESFDLLSNHRRRYALYCLRQEENRATLGELADKIAAWENDIETDAVSYDERKRVYTSLQQVHLPRMDEMNVIEFDDREGVVEPGPAAAELNVYLELVRGNDVPWSAFYLGLAVLNLAVIGGVVAGVFPLTLVPPFGWPVFVVTTFLVTSLAHLYLTRTEMRVDGAGTPPGKPGE
ncbi:hypothetical protein BRC61_00290 [Halobacteriales archaeon QH_10_65_19]|nr:MAG: hypothetical protein BRC61_00290 [Halobacteriales archaeon QH_10_65_19]